MKKMDPHIIIEKLERIGRLLADGAYVDSLNPAQWDALRYLARANRFSRTPRALTAYLGATKGTVSQTIASLEKKGLLMKEPSKTDKRQVILALTDKGQKQLKADPHTSFAEALSVLPEGAKAAVDAGLTLLIQEKIAQNDGAAFGMCKTCKHFRETHDSGTPHFCNLLTVPLTITDANHICMEQIPA